MKNIVKTVGLDLAKSSFHVHCADAEGNRIESKSLRRNQVLSYFEKLPRCTVAMETCTGANWWCRQFREQGHDARLIPPLYVKPFVKSQKNDALDAEAICEAAQRPNMRYAPLKSEESSAALILHRTRRQLIKQRTMNVNRIRAACAEFGVVAVLGTKGLSHLKERLSDEGDLPLSLRVSQRPVLEIVGQLNESIADLEKHIREWHKASEASCRLAEIPGVGVHTATYLTAVLGDGSAYRNGRQFAASLGLVPRQRSTGGRQTLGGITKKGDPQLRALLYEGAFALLCRRVRDGNFPGTARRVAEKSLRVVAVEMANRNARKAWAMIKKGESYDPEHESSWQGAAG